VYAAKCRWRAAHPTSEDGRKVARTTKPYLARNLLDIELRISWIAAMSEWQRDWAREATVPAIAEITVAHGGASGVAFAWEQQLLNSGRK
jgi:hypothetical protein